MNSTLQILNKFGLMIILLGLTIGCQSAYEKARAKDQEKINERCSALVGGTFYHFPSMNEFNKDNEREVLKFKVLSEDTPELKAVYTVLRKAKNSNSLTEVRQETRTVRCYRGFLFYAIPVAVMETTTKRNYGTEFTLVGKKRGIELIIDLNKAYYAGTKQIRAMNATVNNNTNSTFNLNSLADEITLSIKGLNLNTQLLGNSMPYPSKLLAKSHSDFRFEVVTKSGNPRKTIEDLRSRFASAKDDQERDAIEKEANLVIKGLYNIAFHNIKIPLRVSMSRNESGESMIFRKKDCNKPLDSCFDWGF